MLKRIVWLLIPVLAASCTLPAQDRQKQKTDSVSVLVQKKFNEKDVAGLYGLTGDAFKKALSYETLLSFCNNNLFPLGEIKELHFEKEANGICKYKSVFSTVSLSLFLGLDKTDKIETFLFKPYVDEKAKKNTKAPTSNPMVSQLDKEVDSAAQTYITLLPTTGLSIGILVNGKTYYYGYGETARGNNKLPNEHSIYEIGSISKTFTATLLAVAVEKGKVKLDDPVSKYFPDSIPTLEYQGAPVTLKTLSNHSSGIPRMPDNFHPADNYNPYKDYSDRDLYSFYKSFKLGRKPGAEYEYSNLAAATLGIILEKVYKKTYQDLVVEIICDPLGMNETREFIRKDDSIRFVKGYNEEGNYNSQWDFDAMAAAGSIRSSTSDMLLYANAQWGKGPAALEKAIQLTHEKTFSNGAVNTALGWHYIKPGKDEVIFHNGGTGGFRTYLAINLEKKFAVVVLSNTAISVDEMGNALMKWLEQNL
ncbi:MAG TPA: serine hydrolase [Puia sp.]|nr:serine hydrolase [Puia sp.]